MHTHRNHSKTKSPEQNVNSLDGNSRERCDGRSINNTTEIGGHVRFSGEQYVPHASTFSRTTRSIRRRLGIITRCVTAIRAALLGDAATDSGAGYDEQAFRYIFNLLFTAARECLVAVHCACVRRSNRRRFGVRWRRVERRGAEEIDGAHPRRVALVIRRQNHIVGIGWHMPEQDLK